MKTGNTVSHSERQRRSFKLHTLARDHICQAAVPALNPLIYSGCIWQCVFTCVWVFRAPVRVTRLGMSCSAVCYLSPASRPEKSTRRWFRPDWPRLWQEAWRFHPQWPGPDRAAHPKTPEELNFTQWHTQIHHIQGANMQANVFLNLTMNTAVTQSKLLVTTYCT